MVPGSKLHAGSGGAACRVRIRDNRQPGGQARGHPCGQTGGVVAIGDRPRPRSARWGDRRPGCAVALWCSRRSVAVASDLVRDGYGCRAEVYERDAPFPRWTRRLPRWRVVGACVFGPVAILLPRHFNRGRYSGATGEQGEDHRAGVIGLSQKRKGRGLTHAPKGKPLRGAATQSRPRVPTRRAQEQARKPASLRLPAGSRPAGSTCATG